MVDNTMPDESHNYASFRICITSDIVDVADVLGPGWMFRGQSNTKWPLSSSLERETNRLGNPDRTTYEATALRHFKSVKSFDHSYRIAPGDNFSWLAMLQHHGGKTRLVDFTESLYVAAFFAVHEFPETDAAVWAIKTATMDANIASISEKYEVELSEQDLCHRLINNSIDRPDRYREQRSLAISYGRPEHLSQRLIAQQGWFLCPLNLDMTFMDNLTLGLALSGTKDPIKRITTVEELREAAPSEKVIKICVPQSEHRNLLFHFRRMNISQATLFPGLDGFARSLNYFASGMD